MRKILAPAMLLAALSLPMTARADAGKDLSGTYVAHGVGVGGAKYEAKVTITKTGESYAIRWTFGDRDFTGVGIQRDNVLSVGWSNDGKAGVVLYTVDGANLDGKWADGSGDGRIFDETLTPAK